MAQYPDGLWGPLIIRDASDPYANEIDKEYTLTLTDWYHRQMPALIAQYESTRNAATNNGDEPTPDSALINASRNTTFKLEPNKNYLFRIICVGNFPGHAFLFDNHEMTVVEVDGVWLEKYPIGQRNVRIATGQRMSVLVKAKNSTDQNYAIFDTMDVNMLFFNEAKLPPPNYNPNVTAWLVYDKQKALPPPPDVREFNFVDDVDFNPYDKQVILGPVNRQIVMDMNSSVIDGIERFTINDETYLAPEVPSLYTALTVGKNYSSSPAVYGHVNPYVLKYGEIVEIVVNNHHRNLHPFHLHGHQFQVIERTPPNAGFFNGTYTNLSSIPVRRDTIMVQQGGYAVIRFRANNPGVWLFHCHIEWHVSAGLTATMIEAPTKITEKISHNHLKVCRMYPEKVDGNAAGNENHPLDLSGLPTNVPTFDAGYVFNGRF
jgi:iron transport multicopper oxidase